MSIVFVEWKIPSSVEDRWQEIIETDRVKESLRPLRFSVCRLSLLFHFHHESSVNTPSIFRNTPYREEDSFSFSDSAFSALQIDRKERGKKKIKSVI